MSCPMWAPDGDGARADCRPAPTAPSFTHMPWLTLALRLVARSIVDPVLGIALLRTAWRFRSRGWYTRFPFLPLPDQTYVRWRMHTAYGDHDAVPPLEDIVRYARWAARAP